MDMIGDIVERDTSNVSPPAPPSSSSKESKLGRKWRTRKTMHSQMERQATQTAPQENHQGDDGWITPGKPQPEKPQPVAAEEDGIEKESLEKLASMSKEELEEMQRELAGLDPQILASLRRRGEKKRQGTQSTEQSELSQPLQRQPLQKADAPQQDQKSEAHEQKEKELDKSDDLNQPYELHSKERAEAHFPHPPEDLRQYFPDLPVETDKLAWMTPITEEENAEYSAQLQSISPSELRFDFQGRLLTPRMSRAIPVSKGLHHHGDAPSAAGYTILELGHLARSSHPAQRSIAIQTAGRVLHKLRRGQYAKSSDLQEGLQDLVRASRLMETLSEAASEKTRSLTVRTLATEALWLANTDGRS